LLEKIVGTTSTDTGKDAIARGMESAASALRDKADNLPGGEAVAQGAHSTAAAMEAAADYVREQDLRGMLSDLRQTVTRHPGAALLAALAVGFVIARSLARR